MSLDQKEMICKVAKEMGYDKIASLMIAWAIFGMVKGLYLIL